MEYQPIMYKNWLLLALFCCAISIHFGCGNNPTQNTSPEPSLPPAAQQPDSSVPPIVAQDSSIPPPNSVEIPDPQPSVSPTPPTSVPPTPPTRIQNSKLDPARWTEVTQLDRSIAIDIRYATTDNFTKSKIYDCPRCFLRPAAALAIAKAHEQLQKQGLGLKMFDCYRPRPYQQRLWDKVPNPDYVTNPKKGSMHSRGAAVDLTIVDAKGKELDMGTPYDFFGKKAHSDCKDLPKNVLENRELLTKTLESVGFRGIRTEWWHFSFGKKEYELSSDLWDCQ
jgi:zinc D-Ala-D-Ala dipeptidase